MSDTSSRADLPVAFLRRMAELAQVDPNRIVGAENVPGGRASCWQSSLELASARLDLLAAPVVWPVIDAFGAAAARCPIVSIRRDPAESERFEWFALADRDAGRVWVVHEDGAGEWKTPGSLLDWLGESEPTAFRSWVVLRSRFPSSLHRTGPAGAGHGGTEPRHGIAEKAPFRRLVALLRPDRSDLWAIVLFAVMIGGLTLATPIAVQQLVNSIAFGGLVQPVIVLALLLFAVLAFSAVLAALQAYVAELLQRRLFVRVVIDVAERLPRVQARAFDRHHGPELVNRVFDVVTLQKVGSALLLEGSTVLLQTAVGLLVLSFYHPWMLAFSGSLVLGIAVVVFVMGRGAVETAIEESHAKYDVVEWLEELARHSSTFRDPDRRTYALRRSDELATGWVVARRHHFRIVLRQLAGALGLQVVASSALLALGGILVVRGQLTLGQLVASELIITIIVAAVAKFGKQLERWYDVLAATDKLSVLTDLPLEREDGRSLSEGHAPARIDVVDVSFGYGTAPVLDGLQLRIEPGERIALQGAMGSGKSALLDLLAGLREPTAGSIAWDAQDYRELDLGSLRKSVVLVREREIFNATIQENVRVGRMRYGSDEVVRALDDVGLLEEVRALPEGLETPLATDGRPLSQVEALRVMLARAILGRPRLLLLDRVLDDLDPVARERIGDRIFREDAPWTLVVVSEREDVLRRCDRRVVLGAPEIWRDPDAPDSGASGPDEAGRAVLPTEPPLR